MIESENIVNAIQWLGKFRKRILIIFITPIVLSVFMFFWSDKLFKVIKEPLNDNSLYFITPIEAIMAKFKISLYAGILISLPIVLYLIISIFSSVINKRNKRLIHFVIIPFSMILFGGGVLFGFIFILPTTIKFLLSCGDGIMEPIISGNNYISFISLFLLIIGIVFEVPLVLIALARFGIVNSKILMHKRKIVILIIVLVLTVLTPTPDGFTLLLVSLPVILLYELSIWWIYITEKIEKRKNKKSKL